jgi:hypothetical protein
MVDEEHVKAQLKKHFEVDGKVNINSTTGLVDVDGDVKLKEEIKVRRLPVSFDRVVGNFDCSSNQLTSLEGAPTSVGGDFYCYNNNLVSLEGAPTSVGGGFDCIFNKLTSLAGAPTHVSGGFWCSYDKNLPLLRLLAYQRIRVLGASLQLYQILKKYAGTGRRGAIQAAREMLELGEQLQKEQALDHNPFEANARW